VAYAKANDAAFVGKLHGEFVRQMSFGGFLVAIDNDEVMI